MQVNENMQPMSFQHNQAVINHTFGNVQASNAPLMQISHNYQCNEPFSSRKFNDIQNLNSGKKVAYSTINAKLSRNEQYQYDNSNGESCSVDIIPCQDGSDV
jgi:hypothetical protein